MDALEELRETLADRGNTFALARAKQDLRRDLQAAGFLPKVGEQLVFPTLPTAVATYVEAYRRRHGEPPGLVVPPAPRG